MPEYDLYLALGVALAAGLLIGFEREQSAPDDETERRRTFAGGARTYPLVSLAGALAALLAQRFGWAILIGGLVAVLAFTLVNYIDSIRIDSGRGITSDMAFLATYLLGATATSPSILEPVSRRAILVLGLAVAVTLLLSAKPPLHKIAARASKEDLFATLKFLLVVVVILPLLPNLSLGPLGL